MKSHASQKLKSASRITTCCALVLAMPFLNSCEMLENPEVAALAGAGVGALVGSQIGGTRGALIGAAVGGIAGYAISKHYIATSAQKAQAQSRARSLMSQSHVKNSSANYIAVPVTKKEGGGKDIVLVNKQTGVVDDKAYVPPAGTSYSSGQVVSVGGKKAIVASAFQGV